MVLAWQICPKMTFFFDIFQFFFCRGSDLLHVFKRLRDIFHGKIEHSWLCREPMARKKGAHDPYLLAI